MKLAATNLTIIMKIDPIIAVKDVNASALWYQLVFGFKRTHGGNNFAVLMDKNDKVLLCLHEWEAHGHPTMKDPDTTPGNGLILYYKTYDLDKIRQNIAGLGYPLEAEIHVNQNSTKREFSLRDPDGYYITVTEYHEYEG